MELEQLVSLAKQEGVSLGAVNGKFLMLDPSKRLPADLYAQLDQRNSELLQFFLRKARKQDSYWKRNIAQEFTANVLLDSPAFTDATRIAVDSTGAKTAVQADSSTPSLGVVRQSLGKQPTLPADLARLLELTWACLLARYSGEQYAHFFTAQSSRTIGLAGVAEMKGLLVNLQPVALDLPADAVIANSLEQLAIQRQKDHEHGAPLFSDGNTFAGKKHLFDAVLVLDEVRPANTLIGRELSSVTNVATLNLKAMMIVSHDMATGELTTELQFAQEYLCERAAQALLGHFAHLFHQLAQTPTQAGNFSALDMLDASQRTAMLALGRGKRGAPVSVACIHELQEKTSARLPLHPAIVGRDGVLNYEQVNRRANQLARHLLSVRGAANTVIGICMARSPELLISMLAVLKAGCAYLPLDPNYPESRLDYMLNDSGAQLVLANQQYASRLASANKQVIAYDAGDTWFDDLSGENIPCSQSGANAASLAYVIYTSGSTGFPKGVMIEHGAAVSFLQWSRSQFSDAELRSVLCSTSICFDLSIFEIFLPLAVGGQAVVVDSILELFSGERFNAANKLDVSLINCVPSAMAELIENSRIPTSVLTVCLAGEPLRRKLVNRIYQSSTVGTVYNLYGPSEYTTYATFSSLLRDDSFEPRIGRPLDDSFVYVLDTEGKLVPSGVKGELFIGGRNISRGYINQAELTAKKFIADPLRASNEDNATIVYRTGDFVRWNQFGELEFVGRCDDQVKLRGFRLELGEIESRLMADVAVKNAAVMVRDDADGEKRLVAYAALNPEYLTASVAQHELFRENLKANLAKTLPNHMVPEIYVFLDELPLTLNGKIDRKRLPMPEMDDQHADDYLAPSNETERVLCEQFEKLLGISGVGVNDNFFTLGGHSLLVFRLLIAMRGAFNIDLPLKTIFDHATVAQLSKIVLAQQAQMHASLPPIVRIDRQGKLPASFAQQRFWILYKVDENSAEYNLPVVFSLQGPLQLSLFERALSAMLTRHEVLRSVLYEEGGNIYQRIENDVRLPLQYLDFSELPHTEASTAARARFDQDWYTAFKLDVELPIRVILARITETEHHVLFNIHHVATDGWSINVMLQDLGQLYDGLANNSSPSLAELTIQYADFASWQRQCLSGDALLKLRQHWKESLKDIPRLHSLPLDHPRPAVQKGIGRGFHRHLSADLISQFKALCSSQGATLFMGLQTVFAAVLARWSNQAHIVMGTPAAGRTWEAVEPLIGFFMNNVILHNQLAAQASFIDVLADSKKMILRALDGQDLPFDILVADCEVRRDPSHQAIFQVWFVLQSQDKDFPAMQSLQMGPLAKRETVDKIVHFDISLSAIETPEHLDVLWEYQHSLFDASTMEWLANEFEYMLAQALKQPEAVLIAQAFQTQPPALHKAQPAALVDASSSGLLAVLAASSASIAGAPNAIALSDGASQMTYGQFSQQVRQVASYLRAHGLAASGVIAICIPHSAARIIAQLATLQCGAAYLIVEASDVSLLAQCSGLHGILQSRSAQQNLPLRYLSIEEAQAWPNTEHVAVDGQTIHLAELIAPTTSSAASLRVTPVSTTVLQAHLAAQAQACELTADSCLLHLPETCHFAPFEYLTALVLGAQLRLAPKLSEAEMQRVSHLSITASLLASVRPAPQTRLRSILLTGEQAGSWQAWQWAAHCKLWHAYGNQYLPFISAQAVVPGEMLTLGEPTFAGTLQLQDAYGYPSLPGMIGQASLNLMSSATQRQAANALLRYRRDGKLLWHSGAARDAAETARDVLQLHGFALHLAEIEAQIACQEGVLLARLLPIGNQHSADLRLLALIVCDVAERPALAQRLQQFIQRQLPLYQQADYLVLLDAATNDLSLIANEERHYWQQCHALWTQRNTQWQTLGLPTPQQAPLELSQHSVESRLELNLPAAIDASAFLLSALSLLIAFEHNYPVVCMASSVLDEAAPWINAVAAAQSAAQPVIHSAVQLASIATQASIGELFDGVAAGLAENRQHLLYAYLAQFDEQASHDYARLNRAAQGQLLFVRQIDAATPAFDSVAPCAALRLQVVQHGTQYQLTWRYCESQYDAQKVQALSGRFTRLATLMLPLMVEGGKASIATLRQGLEVEVKNKLMDLKNRFK